MDRECGKEGKDLTITKCNDCISDSDINADDVLFGRGATIDNNTGNIRFRTLIKQYKSSYSEGLDRTAKHAVALDIHSIITNRCGRFLRKLEGTDTENQSREFSESRTQQSEAKGFPTEQSDEEVEILKRTWMQVEMPEALKKIKQALREREEGDENYGRKIPAKNSRRSDDLTDKATEISTLTSVLPKTSKASLPLPNENSSPSFHGNNTHDLNIIYHSQPQFYTNEIQELAGSNLSGTESQVSNVLFRSHNQERLQFDLCLQQLQQQQQRQQILSLQQHQQEQIISIPQIYSPHQPNQLNYRECEQQYYQQFLLLLQYQQEQQQQQQQQQQLLEVSMRHILERYIQSYSMNQSNILLQDSETRISTQSNVQGTSFSSPSDTSFQLQFELQQENMRQHLISNSLQSTIGIDLQNTFQDIYHQNLHVRNITAKLSEIISNRTSMNIPLVRNFDVAFTITENLNDNCNYELHPHVSNTEDAQHSGLNNLSITDIFNPRRAHSIHQQNVIRIQGTNPNLFPLTEDVATAQNQNQSSRISEAYRIEEQKASPNNSNIDQAHSGDRKRTKLNNDGEQLFKKRPPL